MIPRVPKSIPATANDDTRSDMDSAKIIDETNTDIIMNWLVNYTNWGMKRKEELFNKRNFCHGPVFGLFLSLLNV